MEEATVRGLKEQGTGPADGGEPYPVTPDGRYFVVRGRLWRATNPSLGEADRVPLVHALMSARRAVHDARRHGTRADEAMARAAVHEAKVALGERGPVWWTDRAPDYNRRMVANSPYAKWFAERA